MSIDHYSLWWSQLVTISFVNVYLVQPVVNDPKAYGLSTTIKEEIEKNGIKPGQVEGLSGGGQ